MHQHWLQLSQKIRVDEAYMNDVLFSIIVPVYNSRKYLSECLDSLLHQSNITYEVIVVNDGSTDGSSIVLEKYAGEHSNLRVITQENRGVSATRNEGIREARGEYLIFVDSDDRISRHTLAVLKENIEKYDNPDIVTYGYQRHYNEEIIEEESFGETLLIKNINIDNFIRGYFLNKVYRTSVWNKAYKRHLLTDNGIEFVDYSQVVSEDCLFNVALLPYIDNVLLIPEYLYIYRVVEGSLSHQKTYMNVLDRSARTIQCVDEYIQNTGYSSLCAYYYINIYIRFVSLSCAFNEMKFIPFYESSKEYFLTTDNERKFCKKTNYKRCLTSNFRVLIYSLLTSLLRCKCYLTASLLSYLLFGRKRN